MKITYTKEWYRDIVIAKDFFEKYKHFNIGFCDVYEYKNMCDSDKTISSLELNADGTVSILRKNGWSKIKGTSKLVIFR